MSQRSARSRLDPAGPQRLADGAALEVLHDDVRLVVAVGGLPDVEDRDHVRMSQAGRRPRLPLEPPAGIGIVAQRAGEQLDRHPAPEQRVVGAPEGRHAAAGDPADRRIAGRESERPRRPSVSYSERRPS